MIDGARNHDDPGLPRGTFLRNVRKLNERAEDLRSEEEALLRANGWKSSSDFPGALWLWSKSFPESTVQKGQEKVPHPGFTINGATTAIALRIEAAWQDVWQ